MISRRWGVLCAIVAALALAAGHLASGAAPASRWIVFSGQVNGVTGSAAQLFRVRSDGSGLGQITRGVKPAIEPDFSPNGNRLAFARLSSGIFLVGIDGTGLRRLTSGGRDIYPVWSPDGKQVAFLRPHDADWRLHVISATGKDLRRLPQAPPAGRPSWSRDGKTILIPSAGDIVKIDARTGKVLKYFGLTIDIQVAQNASVSPDGQSVAYLGPRFSTGPEDCGEGRCPQYALFQARVPAPHRPKRVLNDTGPAGWSSDGRTLAFVHRLGTLSIRTVANGATRTISSKPHVANGDAPPAWQPR